MCHCMVYDINLKNVLRQMKRNIQNSLSTGKNQSDVSEVNRNNQFVDLMKSCMKTFFRRINFDDRSIYLYKIGGSGIIDNDSKAENDDGFTYNNYNQYLKTLLAQFTKENENLTDNYFLMVEVSIQFKNKRKKTYFRDSDEFVELLMQQAIEEDPKVDLNCWLKFKNYFPRRKGES